ncbi:MAG: DUF4251 domain-containing protein [Paludibacteraceae bacterium]
MKKTIYLLILAVVLIGAFACGTKKTAAQLSEEKRILVESIENRRFTFIADYAIPMGNFQPRYLNSYYDVKLTNDTVYSHLPYFGVAYQAPWDPSESPLSFISTKFDYKVTPGKRSGSWIIYVNMVDKRNPLKYIFTIWENGTGNLVVWDFSRQSISFRGKLELK